MNQIYLVLCGNHIPEYAPERDLSDMTWGGTVNDIATMQFPALSRVLEIGTGKDVTVAALHEVFYRWATQGDPLSDAQHKFVELHRSVAFANKFAREVA